MSGRDPEGTQASRARAAEAAAASRRLQREAEHARAQFRELSTREAVSSLRRQAEQQSLRRGRPV